MGIFMSGFQATWQFWINEVLCKWLTTIRCFVILAFVKQRSSGRFEPQTRRPCKKTSFSQISAVPGLGLITRRSQVQVLPPLYKKALKECLFVLKVSDIRTRTHNLQVMSLTGWCQRNRLMCCNGINTSLILSTNFQLIARMYPCPCRFWSDAEKSCACEPAVVTKYQKDILSPLLDRIDTAQPHRSAARGLRKVERRPGGEWEDPVRAKGARDGENRVSGG